MKSEELICKIAIAAMALGILACGAILIRLFMQLPRTEAFTNAQLVQEVLFHAAC